MQVGRWFDLKTDVCSALALWCLLLEACHGAVFCTSVRYARLGWQAAAGAPEHRLEAQTGRPALATGGR
jgi:hypothetical protein